MNLLEQLFWIEFSFDDSKGQITIASATWLHSSFETNELHICLCNDLCNSNFKILVTNIAFNY